MHDLMMNEPGRPILIAGPTASGKSSLALELARHTHGCIINADALQVYACWKILTARPGDQDMATCPHRLFGYVGMNESYSVGRWLRDLKSVLVKCRSKNLRPIIVGGTGLYLTSLTTGLIEIPGIPRVVRNEADRIRLETPARFSEDLLAYDPETANTIDIRNPVRAQRAWEVLTATGIGLAQWHRTPHSPVLPTVSARAFVLNATAEWLLPRIRSRFEHMVSRGALDEVRSAMEAGYDRRKPSCKALGASELVSFINGEHSLPEAIELATIRTRQFAKRQRTWFRNKMADWECVAAGISAKDLVPRL